MFIAQLLELYFFGDLYVGYYFFPSFLESEAINQEITFKHAYPGTTRTEKDVQRVFVRYAGDVAWQKNTTMRIPEEGKALSEPLALQVVLGLIICACLSLFFNDRL